MTDQINVKIDLTSTIEREQEQDEVTKLSLTGQLVEKRDSFYLTYAEEDAEMGESKHVIKVASGQALIMRTGATSMRLPLIVDQETSGTYQSPAGHFSMLAKMDTCDLNWDGEKGMLLMGYELQLQNQFVGKFTLEFKLKAR